MSEVLNNSIVLAGILLGALLLFLLLGLLRPYRVSNSFLLLSACCWA